MSDAPRVTVAGGGLAGITAALRLAERGCRVKLYEQKSMLGGNLATRTLLSGGVLDVYPHMYLGWYRNFWQMLKDAGVERSERFSKFQSVKQLARDAFPKFTELINGYTPKQVLANLHSGVAPLADMVVFGYAGLDLLAEQGNPTMRLHNMSLSGFLGSRPYMTKGAEEAYETFITRVWAIPSYFVSAKDYRTYLDYCFAEQEPVFWLAGGPTATEVIDPLEAALKSAGVEIECNAEVTGVTCVEKRVSTILLRHTTFDPRTYNWVATGEPWSEPVDELVLAVPAKTLSRLVVCGTPGQRIVDLESRLAELARLPTQRVPILSVCFKGNFEGIPREPVGLSESRLNLAFTDISQTWLDVPGFEDHTVLVVSCSDVYALAGATPTENGHQILAELAEYLGFDAGAVWGESPLIEWGWTRYHENYDAELSLNAVGTDVWRPEASCEEVSNLSLAGDFCHQHIGLTTMESAVVSGLNAVNAIVRRRGLGSEVAVLKPRTLPDSLYVLLRYAFGPCALASKAWSIGTEGSHSGAPGAGEEESLVRYLLTPGLPPRHQRRES